MIECYYNKWAVNEPQCPNEGVFKGARANSIIDSWTWCQEHAPLPQFRETIPKEK